MTKLSRQFQEALTLATRLHAGQTRKGKTVPYVAHLLGVASLVLEAGGDEEQAIAALLHDAIEDQGDKITLEEIRSRFGDRVATIVARCTDSTTMPKPPWRARKQAYIAHLKDASPSESLVSIADKLHNARSILADYRLLGEAIWDRFNGGKQGTLWYYRALVDAFQESDPIPLLEELDRVVSEIERLATVQRKTTL